MYPTSKYLYLLMDAETHDTFILVSTLYARGTKRKVNLNQGGGPKTPGGCVVAGWADVSERPWCRRGRTVERSESAGSAHCRNDHRN